MHASLRLGVLLATGTALSVAGAAPLRAQAAASVSGGVQQQVAPLPPSVRGWLGINVALDDATGTRSPVRVIDLYEGGPAHAAGLRVGDVVVEINGVAATPARFVAAVEGLRPGGPIAFTVRRGDDERAISMEAGSRPEESTIFPRIAEARIDSARAVFESRARGFAEARSATPAGGVFFSQPGDSTRTFTVRIDSDGPNWVVRGDTVESRWRIRAPEATGGDLTIELREVQGTPLAALVRTDTLHLRQLRSETALLEARLREVNERIAEQRRRGGPLPDGQLRLADELETRLIETVRLTELADETSDRVAVVGDAVRIRTGIGDQSAVTVRRPLSPYLTGLNRIAGAELRRLNSELASYFEVDGGLLVVEVTDGSPAAESGLLSGDVVLAVNGAAVESVDELRKRIVASPEGWTLTISRRGRTLELRMR